MKEKILAELVKKFPGLSKEFLGFWAEKMAVKTTEESAIEGAIGELEKLPIPLTDLAAAFQKEGDKRATEAATTRENSLKEKFDLVEKKAAPAKPAGEDNKPGDDTGYSKLEAMILNLTNKMEEKEKLSVKDAAIAKFKAQAAEKKIPEFALNGITVENEEGIAEALTKAEQAYTPLSSSTSITKGWANCPYLAEVLKEVAEMEFLP
jgi:hypothetical protein